MAKMCGIYGMADTKFVSPSGLSSGGAANATSARDELKMAIAAASSPKALDIWSTQSRSFAIGGRHARTVDVTSNVFADWTDETLYPRLGGKGGTFPAKYSGGISKKAICAVHDVGGVPIALAILGKGEFAEANMPAITRELCGMMAEKLAGGTPAEGEYITRFLADGGGYAAVPVPALPGGYVNSRTAADIAAGENVLKNNEDSAQVLASTTKLMTLLCALNIVGDLQEVIRVEEEDIKGGSGSDFLPGDRLTFEDALRIMMTESSNTLAETAARCAGGKLLRIARKRG